MKEVCGIKILRKGKKAEMLLDLYNKSTVKSIFEIYPVKDVMRNLSWVKENGWAGDCDASLEEFVRKPLNVKDCKILAHQHGSFAEGSILEFEGEKYLIVFSVGCQQIFGEECAIKL